MSLFFIDQREFIAEVHELIDYHTEKGNCKGLADGVELLVDEYGIQINSEKFSGQIVQLWMCNAAPRSKRLASAIGDRDLRNCWRYTVYALLAFFRLAIFVFMVWGAIVFINWVMS